MKIFKISLAFLCCSFFLFSSCGKDDDNGGGGTTTKTTKLLTDVDFDKDVILEDLGIGIDYRVDVEIYTDRSVLVKPGVTIEFSTNGYLRISDLGSIEAKGTNTLPIEFTCNVKSKGAWAGIMVESNSLRNIFEYCTIEFAGKERWPNDKFGGLSLWSGSTVNIDNCTFRSNKYFGIRGYNSNTVELRSCDNNTFTNNDAPIEGNLITLGSLGIGNKYSDVSNKIHITDGISKKVNVNLNVTTVPYYSNTSIDVADGASLTLAPGVTFEFDEASYIRFDGTNAYLSAKGTIAKPILFTSTDKKPGTWGGIAFSFTSTAKNIIENATIEYAGSNAFEFQNGALYMWADPTIVMNNVTFKDIKTCVFNDNANSFEQPNLVESNIKLISTGSKYCQ